MAGAQQQIKGEGDLTNMRASPKGREELAARVQQALALPTK
jgi:hypothetical protein